MRFPTAGPPVKRHPSVLRAPGPGPTAALLHGLLLLRRALRGFSGSGRIRLAELDSDPVGPRERRRRRSSLLGGHATRCGSHFGRFVHRKELSGHGLRISTVHDREPEYLAAAFPVAASVGIGVFVVWSVLDDDGGWAGIGYGSDPLALVVVAVGGVGFLGRTAFGFIVHASLIRRVIEIPHFFNTCPPVSLKTRDNFQDRKGKNSCF